MQFEEAKQLAARSAQDSDQSWYVIQVGDDFKVVSKSELEKLPGHTHQIAYGAAPGKGRSA